MRIAPQFGPRRHRRQILGGISGAGIAICAAIYWPSSGSGAARQEPPLCDGVTATIAAPPGESLVKGTPGNDVIVGNGQQNTVRAKKGDDLVCGEARGDLILGQRGDDELLGQGGDDFLLGNGANDRLRGGIRHDHLNGGAGIDRCRGRGRIALSNQTCEVHRKSPRRGLRRHYYLGNSFGGLHLRGILTYSSYRGWSSFVYGHRPRGAVPLAVQNWSICHRYPAAYPSRLEVFPFRGAKAAWNPYGGGLEIYTRRVAIVIFSDTRTFDMAAARAVRDVTGARFRRLPPPVKGSLAGKLSCQS